MDLELMPGSGTRKFKAGSGSGINHSGSTTLVVTLTYPYIPVLNEQKKQSIFEFLKNRGADLIQKQLLKQTNLDHLQTLQKTQ